MCDVIAWAVVVVVLAGWLLKTPVHASGWERKDLNDYTLNLRHSREVDSSHQYPFGFTYPPPSVLFRLGLGSLGFEFGGGLWIAVSGLSLLVSLFLVLKLVGWNGRHGWGVLALGSLLLVKYPFEFEYKYLNSNAMFLALVLLGLSSLDSNPRLAGLFLSLSIALKLYSVVFLPWLVWTRRTRVAGWATAFAFAWFLAAPLLHWNWANAWEIHRSWLERVGETGSRDFPIAFSPFAYLVSLHAAVLTILERCGLEDVRSFALWLTRIFQGLWIVAIVFVLRRSRKEGGVRNTLIDACVLLLLPLPLSGQLQPHHAVILLPASTLFLIEAADRNRTRFQQAIFIVVLVGGFLVMEYGPPRPWRGLALNATFVLYLVGLATAKSGSERKQPYPETPGIIHE